MSNPRTAAQALRLASSTSTQQYVCRACRAQAARQFHTSSPNAAELPFYKRLQNTLFGSKESREAEKSREEKQKRRSEELQTHDEGEELEIKTSKTGRQYEVARIIEPGTHKDYVPATSWDGLERVGNTHWVKARADKGEQYVGFVPAKKLDLTNKQWEALLHHIMVEALVLQKAGRPAGQVCYPRAVDSGTWKYTRNGTIQPSATGGNGISVTFTDAESEQRILQAIPEVLPEQQVPDEQLLLSEVQNVVAQRDPMPADWMDISLQDPALKMALIKRTLQLTSHRLPDPAISTSSTLSDLYTHLSKPVKAKKLFETSQLQRLKVQAPNVKVHGNRQTPIHKEKEVGRWKVIEEELVRRGLPVTGSRFVGAKALYR